MKRLLLFLGLAMPLLMGPRVFAVDVFERKDAMPGLQAGVQAPDFTAKSYLGRTVRLADYYQQGPVVLIFYRGVWCPYCNRHLRAFQDHLAEIEAQGASVLAVSVDQPQFAARAVAANQLGFEVITDPEAEILAAYDLIYQIPDEVAEVYRTQYGIDLPAYSGRDDHVIAIPATYVIDSSGEIVFAYADEDYQKRTQPQAVLSVLEKLSSAGGSGSEGFQKQDGD